jgi:molybdopterin/thiamine biosynthesis adenylyltransferase
MTDEELLRYSRHILLDEIGIEGQQRLSAARALIVGLGGLGSPVALYLASSGVGHVTLMDSDAVDLTNLQRQIAHTGARTGQPKVDSAREAMLALNSGIQVTAYRAWADARELAALVGQMDVVLDCTDNFATRQAVNAACVAARVPLVSGSAIRFDGQLAVYDSREPHSPCYACLFPLGSSPEQAQCATMGVFAPLTGVIGSLQAAEALKLLAGGFPGSTGALWMLDGKHLEWSRVAVSRRADCEVCARSH